MGLDMYLTKKTYVKNWEHNGPEGQNQITVQKGGKPHPSIKPERITYVIEQVAYWRKANAIHDWFVKHVQEGVDNCGDYYVSHEQLQKLMAACMTVLATSKRKPGKVKNGERSVAGGPFEPILEDGEVIADPQVAETVLPTKGGFFFGSTDYDQFYLRDIEYTTKVLAEILAEDECSGDLYYHSSW